MIEIAFGILFITAFVINFITGLLVLLGDSLPNKTSIGLTYLFLSIFFLSALTEI
jgi:hypothetical protein